MTNEDVYRKAIGSLLYLSTNSRPDIAVGTSILARHVSNPKQADWTEVKRIFRYLNKTKEKKLRLGSTDDQSTHQLIGYADADWGGDAKEKKIEYRICVQISWSDDIMDKSKTVDGYIIVNRSRVHCTRRSHSRGDVLV